MPDLDTTRTVTIAELATARGTTRKAARALVARRRWSKRTGNDGTLRVDVPVGELEPDEAPRGRLKGVPNDRPKDDPRGTLTDALIKLARIEAELSAERERTTDLRDDRDRWAELASQLRADLEASRTNQQRPQGLFARLWKRAA